MLWLTTGPVGLMRPSHRSRGAGLLLVAAWLIAHASPVLATGGHLVITAPEAGRLQLASPLGWTRSLELSAGTTSLWDLPAGEYVAHFSAASNPQGDGSEEITGAFSVWDEITVRVEILPAAGGITESFEPLDGRGLVDLIPSELMAALPGEGQEVLRGLDTHIRWRPGVRLDGREATATAQRSERVLDISETRGPAWIALSPGGLHSGAALWNLTSGIGRATTSTAADTATRRLRPAFEVAGSSRDGKQVSLQATLPRNPLCGEFARAWGALRFTNPADASPRARAERILPHNDARMLSLSTQLELGAPAATAIAVGSSPAQHALQGPGAIETGRWGLALRFDAAGSERNHFLEIYRKNIAHAPHEEEARLDAEGVLTVRIGARSRAQVSAGYTQHEAALGDGVHRKDLLRYARIGNNAETDESGLYWANEDVPEVIDAHVFDYYLWHQTQALRGAARYVHARGTGLHIEAFAEGSAFTYRRFEHFAPSEIPLGGGTDALERALNIGYDPLSGRPADEPSPAGKPQLARCGIAVKKRLSPAVQLDLSAGALWYGAQDSALVALHDPYRGDGQLDPHDLQATDTYATGEGSLGLRWARPQGPAAWATAYRLAYLPPWEALYRPRAYLAQTQPEGVMGNPALTPEVETGAEIGLALNLPFTAFAEQTRLAVAGYAARLDDALTTGAAWVGIENSLYEGWVPVYENGGTLRRWGLHAEASTRNADAATWVRLSYDYGRIESDRFESPLLDAPWLFPDQSPGEYASEGYPGPLGGILDEILSQDPRQPDQEFRPANLDREHCMSLAMLHRIAPAPARARALDHLLGGWTLACLARLESGRPYTQAYIHPAVLPPGSSSGVRGPEDPAWEQLIADALRNALRMPTRLFLDVALSRRLAFGPWPLTFSIEALNLLDMANVVSVYRATGEADDDGCLSTPGCTADAAAYAERLVDPLFYDRPFVLRAALRAELY